MSEPRSLRPVNVIVDELVSATIALNVVRERRAQAVAVLADADGALDTAKARVSGLHKELEHLVDERSRVLPAPSTPQWPPYCSPHGWMA